MVWFLIALALLALFAVLLIVAVACDAKYIEPKRRRREENARLLRLHVRRYTELAVKLNANNLAFAEAAQRMNREMQAFAAHFANFKIPE